MKEKVKSYSYEGYKEILDRVKGIINVAGLDRPLVIHGVQHVFHPPQLLDAWPGEDRRTRLVVIAKELDHKELLECFSALGLMARVTH